MKERCRDGCRTSLLIAGYFSYFTSILPSLHHHSFHGNDFFHLYNILLHDYFHSSELNSQWFVYITILSSHKSVILKVFRVKYYKVIGKCGGGDKFHIMH